MENGLKFDVLFRELTKTGFKFTPFRSGEGATLGAVISALIPYLFAAAGLLLLLYLLYGGLSLMLSRGDPKAIQSAKDKITSAVMGFVIVFVSYWLVQIVGTILGIGAITDIFK